MKSAKEMLEIYNCVDIKESELDKRIEKFLINFEESVKRGSNSHIFVLEYDMKPKHRRYILKRLKDLGYNYKHSGLGNYKVWFSIDMGDEEN